VVNDNAVIGESAVGRRARVRRRREWSLPPRTLVAGVPGAVIRELTDGEIAWKSEGTASYQELTRAKSPDDAGDRPPCAHRSPIESESSSPSCCRCPSARRADG
jgi:phenylacetic acid degradation protein